MIALPMRVSRHAAVRYWQRVGYSPHLWVKADICEQWSCGEVASDLDLERARVTRDVDKLYRVGRSPDGLRFLMIAKDGVILTVLRMR